MMFTERWEYDVVTPGNAIPQGLQTTLNGTVRVQPVTGVGGRISTISASDWFCGSKSVLRRP